MAGCDVFMSKLESLRERLRSFGSCLVAYSGGVDSVFLARVSEGKADALSAAEALRMATLEGARACRVDAGRIEAGRLADMAIVDLGGAHMRPIHDLVNMLVFCTRADDVRETIIGGQVVMRERQVMTVDEASLLLELEEIEAALFAGREGFRFDVDFTLGGGQG